MSESSKGATGYAANKAEVAREMSEAMSLDSRHLATKARKKANKVKPDCTQMQEIQIPSLSMTVYAKKDKDPKEVIQKYIDHAKEMKQRQNPALIVPPVKAKETKTKANAKKGNAIKK